LLVLLVVGTYSPARILTFFRMSDIGFDALNLNHIRNFDLSRRGGGR
jgi:hypothetical protein